MGAPVGGLFGVGRGRNVNGISSADFIERDAKEGRGWQNKEEQERACQQCKLAFPKAALDGCLGN